jgi:hypothetical protein
VSRTFSFDFALTCGLDHADSDHLVIMASNLQDPTETIPSLLREIEKGFAQVTVRIGKRSQAPITRRLLTSIFYNLNFWASDGLIPKIVSDFRIMRRKVYKEGKLLRESHRFMRGLSAWTGFNTSAVTIERPPRFAGKSRWLGMSFYSVLASAVRRIFAFSVKPLSIIAFSSIFLGQLALVSLIPLKIVIFTQGVYFGGFGTLIGFAVLSTGVIMITPGTISVYFNSNY